MKDVFLKYLGTQVKKYRTEYSLTEGKAFGLWYAVDSLELEEDEAYETVSCDGGNDKVFLRREGQRVSCLCTPCRG